MQHYSATLEQRKSNRKVMKKKILVTGASGFIGSFIVEKALNLDMEVWAAVRKSSSRRWLQDERIRFIELNLSSYDELCVQLKGLQFDYVVHAAGVTKCTHAADFERINTLGTENLVWAIKAVGMTIEKFLFVSSLSVFGAIREQQPYTEITDGDRPRPNTAYGRSKLKAEKFLSHVQNFPYVIVRPTGVYGPRESDYFMMAQSISRHVDFSVGFRRQDITFVYVADLVDAIFLALQRGVCGSSYFVSDGGVYSSRTFSDLIHSELGRPWLLRIKAPLWLLRVATFVGEYVGRITGRPSALNNDKYHILKQRNWRCDISPTQSQLGYSPRYTLERGVRETIKWYKQNGWL